MLSPSRATLVAILALFGALALLPVLLSNYYVTFLSAALISAMIALSLQLLVGGVGLVSLGHAAFFGLAAYSVHFATKAFGPLSILVTLPVAALAAAAAALLIGAVALRTRSFFFLMTTLAFGQMIFFLFHDTGLGGGADGVFLVKPEFSAFGWGLELDRRGRTLAVYYLNLGLLAAMYLALVALLRSLFGRALDGIRLNEHRMQALGYQVYRYKLAAFTIAGLLAGVAGHMWSLQKGVVNPELAGWHQSAAALLMILLGGLRSLHGPILGALALAGLAETADLVTDRPQLVEGLVILFVVLVLPRGLSGLRLPGFLRGGLPGRRQPAGAEIGAGEAITVKGGAHD